MTAEVATEKTEFRGGATCHTSVDEHHAVRQQVGLFDLSHLTVIDVSGRGVTEWLRYLLTGDVARMSVGQVLHACLCRDDGGVIDHLFVYRLDDERYRLTANAETRPRVRSWLEDERHDEIDLAYPDDEVLLAVQGPASMQLLLKVLEPHVPLNSVRGLEKFQFFLSNGWLVSRTGYTGEDGVEIVLPEAQAVALWQALLDEGVSPAGLGARDTLRLEAGMHLYGNDLDEESWRTQEWSGGSIGRQGSGCHHVGNLQSVTRLFCGTGACFS